MAKSLQRDQKAYNRLYQSKKNKNEGNKKTGEVKTEVAVSLNNSNSCLLSKSFIPNFDLKLHSP